MEYKGLTLDGPASVKKQILDGTSVNSWHQRSWEWAGEFCRDHPEHRDWVEDALVEIVIEHRGDDLAGRGDRPQVWRRLQDRHRAARRSDFPKNIKAQRLAYAISPARRD